MFTRPDNGVYPSTALSSDIDLAELAARLTFIRQRRNGRVIFYDDFSDAGLAWTMNPIGVSGYYTYFVNAVPHTPPGMALLCGTAGVSAVMQTWIPSIAQKSLGIEVTFKFDLRYLPGLADYFTIFITTTAMQAGIRFDITNNRLQIYSSAGVWGTPSWLPATTRLTGAWNNMKVVIDTENIKYKHAYFNRAVGDGDTDAYNAGVAGGLSLELQSLDAAAGTAGIFVDNVIVTTDEKL